MLGSKDILEKVLEGLLKWSMILVVRVIEIMWNKV
jgi:hypothetical protein